MEVNANFLDNEVFTNRNIEFIIFTSDSSWINTWPLLINPLLFDQAPDGETQPSTEVDLFISTEKIMVLNTDLKEIMMDHALRTISYIADIGDLVVLMARRRFVPHEMEDPPKINRTPKMICHVFESDEVSLIIYWNFLYVCKKSQRG